MAGQFDVSMEIINWEVEMAYIEKEVEEFAADDVVGRVRFATDKLKTVTPVDTGQARSSWKNSITFRNGELRDAEITSDVDYMERLNSGSSQQAPAFFIEQVLTKIGIITVE